MNKILKMTMIVILAVSTAYGLDNSQKHKIKVAYNIGKIIKAKDGMTFENGLPSIMGQESSFGIYVVGDKWENGRLKSLYDSSLGNFQIKLSTAKLTIKKYPHLRKRYGHLVYDGKSIYKKFEKHKRLKEYYKELTNKGLTHYIETKTVKSKHIKKIKYYSDILNNPIWIERYERKTKRAIATFKWAKKELVYHKAVHKRETKNVQKEFVLAIKKLNEHRVNYNRLLAKANKDTRLINMLLTNFEFGAVVSGHYLLSMYEEAIRKGYTGSQAYWRSIGRYNGGWNNITYYTLIKKRMKIVKKVMKG